MNDLQKALRQGDPLASDSGLSATDVQRIQALIQAQQHTVRPRRWAGALLLGTTGVVAMCAIAVIQRGRDSVEADGLLSERAANATAQIAEPPIRQLQFSTTGGTRIIWVFDPAFDVR